MGFGNLNKSGGGIYPGLNGSRTSHNGSLVQEPDYENLKNQSPAGFPVRPAPRPPAPLPANSVGMAQRQNSIFNTLGPNYSELDGVPFQLAPQLRKGDRYSIPQNLFTSLDNSELGYDFELEREVLCTTKAIKSTNPFFNWMEKRRKSGKMERNWELIDCENENYYFMMILFWGKWSMRRILFCESCDLIARISFSWNFTLPGLPIE